jgi:hypothetical protein
MLSFQIKQFTINPENLYSPALVSGLKLTAYHANVITFTSGLPLSEGPAWEPLNRAKLFLTLK